MVEIGRKRRSKRVSWAPGANLCQVKLFLSEDAPSQCGRSASQDHLQAKDSWTTPSSSGPAYDDSLLPPGFESVHNQTNPKTDISKIPLVRWKCPPKIVLNPEWYVVSGQESQEIAKQNQRNFGVLEAIYPRQSTIPPNPSVSAEAQEFCQDDSLTRLVPLTAVEDDDPSDAYDYQPVQSEPSLIPSHQSSSVPCPTITPPAQAPPSSASGSAALADVSVVLSRLGAHADVAAATAAAITALTSTSQGNLIDQDLLIKILSDPSQIEKLLPENRNPNPRPPQPTTSGMAMSAPIPPAARPPLHSAHLFNSVSDPNPRPTRPVVPATASVSLPPLPSPPLHHNVPLFNGTRNSDANSRQPHPVVTNTVPAPLPPIPPPPRPHIIPSFSNARPSISSPVAPPLPPPPPPQMVSTTSKPLPSVTQAKDANYYKNLIKQHGGENMGSTNPNVAGTGAGVVQFKGQQRGVTGTCDGTKSKIQKTCAYFNTARGCRHGDSCLFLHESSIKSEDERAKKRVKVDSGIVGRI